jgi:hypothetical protein
LASINCKSWRRSTAKVDIDQPVASINCNCWRRSTAIAGVDQLFLSINCWCLWTVSVDQLLASVKAAKRCVKNQSLKLITAPPKMIGRCKVCSKKSENDDCVQQNGLAVQSLFEKVWKWWLRPQKWLFEKVSTYICNRECAEHLVIVVLCLQLRR